MASCRIESPATAGTQLLANDGDKTSRQVSDVMMIGIFDAIPPRF